MMKKYIIYLLSAFLLVSLVACQEKSKKDKHQQEKIVVAKMEQPTQQLFYAGSLSPLVMESVFSPVAGHIEKIRFIYGQYVKKGDELFLIDSENLTQEYQKVVSDYLQKKSALANALEEYQGSEALFKAGVIAHEAFITSESQYRSSQLNFYQTRFELKKILLQTGIDPKEIEKIRLGNVEEVKEILHREFKRIAVKSPASGVALFPLSDDAGGSEKTERLQVGADVKRGQMLLSIGGKAGLSTLIEVNEVNINRIKKDMSALVTGNAFPGVTLKGHVAAVSSQAKTSQGGQASADFPVLINIPKLSKEALDLIRVGMTAKIAIEVKQKAVLMLPIAAVSQKEGATVVTIETQSGERKTVPVVTGFTTPTKVAIVRGVKKGDRVVIPVDSAKP